MGRESVTGRCKPTKVEQVGLHGANQNFKWGVPDAVQVLVRYILREVVHPSQALYFCLGARRAAPEVALS